MHWMFQKIGYFLNDRIHGDIDLSGVGDDRHTEKQELDS